MCVRLTDSDSEKIGRERQTGICLKSLDYASLRGAAFCVKSQDFCFDPVGSVCQPMTLNVNTSYVGVALSTGYCVMQGD